MEVKQNKKYRIKGSSPYFNEKYGTPNPEYRVEGLWKEITGESWMDSDGNPAAMLFAMRAAFEMLPIDDNVYYGKVMGMGELVHESELEEI